MNCTVRIMTRRHDAMLFQRVLVVPAILYVRSQLRTMFPTRKPQRHPKYKTLIVETLQSISRHGEKRSRNHGA